jgi:serine/threonine-protein kinase
MRAAPVNNLHQSVIDHVRARIGTTLKSTWRVDALIGMGGMAAVYSATAHDGSRVAIKILHAALSINDGVRKRFAREGKAANSIGHHGVARVIDDGIAGDGSAFLVMELLEGETAAARTERFGGKLPVNEVAFIGEAVAEVLAAAHAKNIIHRDVKPDNVFVTTEGRIVVLDFGIARVADAAGVSESATRTGTMMGTPAFMPPEQARGRANEMDATSDVWALGATLFFLASGRLVHEAETANEQLVAAATLPAPSLARVMVNAPAPLVTVIDKALEYAKENRFRDAVAMKHALHAAVLAVSWSSLPGLSDDETVAEPKKNFARLAAKLKPAGLDDATTIAQQRSPVAHLALPASAREALRDSRRGGPTIGPVEISPDERTSKFVRAAVIGALVGALVLAFAAIASRKLVHSQEPDPNINVNASVMPTLAQSAAQAAGPSVTVIATAQASATPIPIGADSATTPSPITSATASALPSATAVPTRKSWLDRRK